MRSLLILGGILAISALILAKKPDAKALIDKLDAVPGADRRRDGRCSASINFARAIPYLTDAFRMNAVLRAASMLTMLGVLDPARRAVRHAADREVDPRRSTAEQKALELHEKVAPYQVILGLVGTRVGADLPAVPLQRSCGSARSARAVVVRRRLFVAIGRGRRLRRQRADPRARLGIEHELSAPRTPARAARRCGRRRARS